MMIRASLSDFAQSPVPTARSLPRLEDEVQLRAVRAPGLQVVVAHYALDGGALVLLLVELEVGVCDPGLVETQGLARVCDDALHLRRGGHTHARPHTDGWVGHEDLADLGGAK